MSKVVLLDSGPFGMYANPKVSDKNTACKDRVDDLLSKGTKVLVPEIVFYEVGRKFHHLHLQNPTSKNLVRLNAAVQFLGLLPITSLTWNKAIELWAQARHDRHSTAGDDSIDGDVLLVAQAKIEIENGASIEIATTNVKHFAYFGVKVLDWQDLK